MISTVKLQQIDSSGQILCGYTNTTNQLQIIRIVNASKCYFERVVFPRERLLFEAQADAELEVHTNYNGRAILVKKILSFHLKVDEARLSISH